MAIFSCSMTFPTRLDYVAYTTMAIPPSCFPPPPQFSYMKFRSHWLRFWCQTFNMHSTIVYSIYFLLNICNNKSNTERLPSNLFILIGVRDWSLIMGKGLQNGKITGPKLFAPPPSRELQKLPSFRGKTTPKYFLPPLWHGSNFLRLPFFVGVKLPMPPPPLPFCSPLPVISD